MRFKRKPLGYYSKKAFKEAEMEHELGHETQAPTMPTTPMVMPFGKYRGYKLKDIPVPYLEWVRTTFDSNRYRTLINNINKTLRG